MNAFALAFHLMGSTIPIALGDILLGKYRVERMLGKGGMGVVIAARHIELDELFAIKLMLPDAIGSTEAIERFLREARAAAKLKGEHVAKVVDVGRLPDGEPYMVLEYLTGSDLKEVVRQRGMLSVEEAITYALQACETLSEAHALGIVHRDIKPANLFLTRKRNGAPCVKVLDFGISKNTRSDAVALTATSSVGGSPLYMSPEQMRSAKYVDHRTDIWSMGIVLYELLTGITPFAAESITAVAGRVLTEEPEPPSHTRRHQTQGEVSAAVDTVVLRCLAKHPEGRFQSVDELMAALHAALRGEVTPPQTGTDDMTVPLTRGSFSVISHAPGVPGAAPTPATSAAPMTSTTAGFEKSSSVEKTQRRAGSSTVLVGAIVLLVMSVMGTAGYLMNRSSHESVAAGAASEIESPSPTGTGMGPSFSAPPQPGTAEGRPPGTAAVAALTSVITTAAPQRSTVIPAIPQRPGKAKVAVTNAAPQKAAATASQVSPPSTSSATPSTTTKSPRIF